MARQFGDDFADALVPLTGDSPGCHQNIVIVAIVVRIIGLE
jgi:hypothetical protein